MPATSVAVEPVRAPWRPSVLDRMIKVGEWPTR
jgi:hypothetical protein